MKGLALLVFPLMILVSSCGQAGQPAEKPDYSAAEKIHREAMAIEKQIEGLVPTVEAALASGRDSVALQALIAEFRDYQKMIPEIPSGEHVCDHGHSHDHDHAHSDGEMPSAETILSVQQEYKTKMEELLQRFQAVQ
jgi:hypothetical protein